MIMSKKCFLISVLCVVSFLFFFLLFHKKPKFDVAADAFSDIGIETYIYAYPLVVMETTKNIMTQDGAHKNIFIHSAEFPTEAYKSIVRPNVDTLYSFAWLDLSEQPLVLSVPDTQERYYLIECMDAWTNVFASLGKRTTGTKAQKFIMVGPNWQGNAPENLIKIKAPTNMVLLLGRTHTYGPQDYAAVHAIQEGYTLTTLSDWLHDKKSTKQAQAKNIYLTNAMIAQQKAPVDVVAAMDAETFYTTFVQSLKNNPPALEDGPMIKKLEKIGINRSDENFSFQMLHDSMKKASEKIQAHYRTLKKINGWGIMLNIGTYGTDYLTRAMTAAMGIGANIPEDAVYPTAFVDAHNNPLMGKNNYRIHFKKGELPPVNAFWSLTLYNAESFLIQNSLHRYALNDKDPLYFNPDGSLDIYIQHASPEKKLENNWLPAPEGIFNLTMRLYWPKKSVLDGSWVPPAIEKIG